MQGQKQKLIRTAIFPGSPPVMLQNHSPELAAERAWAIWVQNLALVERVRELAAAKGCTPGQLALAWVHAQGDDVFPIPGTRRIKYLEENIAAAHIKLTPQDKQALEEIFDVKAVSSHSQLNLAEPCVQNLCAWH